MSWRKKKRRGKFTPAQKKQLKQHLTGLSKLGVEIIEVSHRVPLRDKIIVVKGGNT